MPRLTAWSILRSGPEISLRGVEPACREAGLDGRDRALVRRLVGTEVRRRGTLRALVRHFARGRPSRDLVCHLHLGLVQLYFLDRVPEHAALSATGEAVRRTSGPSKVRYVNGVLRSALRARRPGLCGDPTRDLPGRELHLAEPVFRDPVEHPLLWAEDALSLPAALAKRWTKRWGRERAEELARLGLAEARVSVRAVGCGRAELARELAGEGLEAEEGPHERILILPPDRTEGLIASEAFRRGRATIQGEAALRAAELVGAAPGEEILDLCAAPGGKTAVLAEAGARVWAVDRRADRLERLRETLDRLALSGRVEAIEADASGDLSQALGSRLFDAVLVDAPCTNTGVLAQRPSARWRWGPKARASLLELQRRLLEAGAARVRPGGRLVWSTCSLEPEENGQMLARFLAESPGWERSAEVETLPGPADGPGPVDGGWCARLLRS